MPYTTEKEIAQCRIERREFHPDGSIFYDVHGHKYLLNSHTKSVTRLTEEPDLEIYHALSSLAGHENGDLYYRRAAAMCGNGIFRRMSRRLDPRELYDIEYEGELMYNMEADADLQYVILNRVKFSPLPLSDYPGQMTIRGSFKRIAIINSQFVDTKIMIISDINPEIFIIGSNMSASSVQIVDNNGREYDSDKIRISETMPSDEELEQLLDYIRSDADDILEEDVVEEGAGGLAASAAACLAFAGLIAATKAKKKTKKEERTLAHVIKQR
jgi:hypothetical protein